MSEVSLDFLSVIKSQKYRQLLYVILNNVDEGVIFTNQKNEILYINDRFTEITGYTLSEIKGKTPKFLQSGIQGQDFYEEMKRQMNLHGRWKGNLWNRTKQGDIYLQELELIALQNERDEIENFIGIFSRISGTKKDVEKDNLDYIYYDPLTNLPNRMLFEKRLFSTIQLLNKDKSNVHNFAIIFFKFQNFTKINENYGMLFGNVLLKRIAERLKRKAKNHTMVTRWDGTVFACIVEGFEDESEIAKLINNFESTVTSPFHINETDISLDVHFGISVYKRFFVK